MLERERKKIIRTKAVLCGVAETVANLTDDSGLVGRRDWKCATRCSVHPPVGGYRPPRKPRLGNIDGGQYRGRHGVVKCPH